LLSSPWPQQQARASPAIIAQQAATSGAHSRLLADAVLLAQLAPNLR
jgi:hypothetical protein